MSEADTIKRVQRPSTRDSLASELRRLGVESGMTLLVHSSLSKLGWVVGGPVTVIQALMDVLTPQGTLVLPAHSTHLTDPADWQNPPIPQEWHETVRNAMPLFDPQRTQTRKMGAIAELFRTWPDVLRSTHPHMSFAAWGQQAEFVTTGHKLPYSLGETSPLARVYDLDGHVLLLGVGYNNNTSMHLAEYRAPNPPLEPNGAPWLVNGRKVWQPFDDIAMHDELFAQIGIEFETTRTVRVGQVGVAECRLMGQRTAVDFTQTWFTQWRSQKASKNETDKKKNG